MNALDIDEDVVELLQKRRLTYFGHVSRTQPERYPHILLHGHISGSPPQGRPRKKWIDNIKEDCNRLELTLTEATRTAQDQHQWQSIVRNLGCQCARTSSSSALSQVRQLCQAQATDHLSPFNSVSCCCLYLSLSHNSSNKITLYR